MKYRHLLPILVAMSALPTSAQTTTFNRYTEELTPLLETDAVSVLVTGGTFEIAQTLCRRLGGSLSENVETEYAAWLKRNDIYLRGAATVVNKFGDRYMAHGGESAKQEYLQMILFTSANAGKQRLALQLKGHSVENGAPPPEKLCSGLAKWLRDGVNDFDRTPEHTQALLPYIQRTTVQ